MEGLYEGQKIANLKHFLVTLEEYARGKGFQLAIARRSDYILIKCFCCGLHSDDMPLAVSQTQKKKGKKKKGKTKTETKEAAQKDQNTAEKAEVIRDKVNRWHVVLKLCYERKPLYNHLADAACTPRHALGDINSSDPNGKFGETFKTVEIEEDCGSRAGWSWHGYNIYSINMKHDRSGHDRCEKQCRRKASLSKAASPRSRKAISYCQTFSHCHAEPLDETHFDILPGLRMRKVIPFHAVSHELDAEDLERLGRLQKMKSRASSACAFCHQPISIEHARPNDSYEDVNEETDIIRYELGKHKLAKRTAYKDVSDLYVHRSCASWSALAEVYNDGTIDNVLSEVARSTKLHCHICKKGCAPSGCYSNSCRKSFHYSCAKKHEAMYFHEPTRAMFCSAHGTEFEIFEKEQEAWFAEQEKAKKEAEAAAAEAAAAAAAIGIDTDSETDTEYETDGDSDHTPVNNRRKKGKRGKKATHNSAKGKGRASGNGARKRGRVAKKGGEVRKKRKYTKKKTLAGKGRGGKKSKTKATKGKERGRRTKGDQKKGRQAIDDVGMVIDLLSTEEDDGDDFEDADVHDDDDLLPLQVQTMIRGLRGSAQTERREKRMQQHFDYKQNVADRLCLKSFSYDFPLLRHSSTTPHSCHQSHQQQHMSQEREKEKEKEKEEEDGKGTIDEAEGEKNRSRVDLQEETSKESISSSGDRSDNSIYSKLGQLKEKKHVNPETCRMQRYRRDMVRRMRSYIDDKYFNSSRIWTSAVKVPRSESRKIGHSTATAEDTNANAGTEFGLAVHCDSDGKLDKEGCNDVNMKPNCGGSGNSNGNADDGSAGIDTSENKNRATSSGAQTLDGNKPFEVLSNGEEVIFYETSSIYSL